MSGRPDAVETSVPSPSIVSGDTFRERAASIGLIFPDKTPRKIVVTGLGAITPIGGSPEHFWRSLLSMKSGGVSFDVRNWRTNIAAPVPSKYFNPEDHFSPGELKELTRVETMAIKMVRDALTDADANESGKLRSDLNPNRVGNFMSTGYAAAHKITEIDRQIHKDDNWEENSRRIRPNMGRSLMPEQMNGMIGIHTAISGYGANSIEACGTSLSSLTLGAKAILSGEVEMAVCGGLEELLSDGHPEDAIALFAAFRGALSTRNDNPAAASRPYDIDRDGFVLASGGATLILEDEAHAIARGANIKARILGVDKSQDGYDVTKLAAKRVAATLVKACVDPNDSAVVYKPEAFFAHATSTQFGDKEEAEALRIACQVLDVDHKDIPVTAIKSMIGHLAGGSGAANALAAVMAVRRGKIPAIRNLENVDPAVADLNLVREQYLSKNIHTALASAFGFGGYGAAALIGKNTPRRFNPSYYQRGA